jgi:hypothetical protein
MRVFLVLSVCIAVWFAEVGQGQQSPSQASQPDQSETINNAQPIVDPVLDLNGKSVAIDSLVDEDTAQVKSAGSALVLFRNFTDEQFKDYFQNCPSKTPTTADKLKKDFTLGSNPPNCNRSVYAAVHVLKWGPASGQAQSVLAQTWYLYLFSPQSGSWQAQDVSKSGHLTGVGDLYFLFLQFGADPVVSSKPSYTISVTKKTPANLAHLFAAAQAAGLNTSSVSAVKEMARAAATPMNYWGGGYVALKYKTSTVSLTSNMGNGSNKPTQLGQVTYDNEGKLYWDISFGVPIRKLSQVQVNSVAGTLAPVSVDKQNVFVIADGYLPGLDPAKNSIAHWPHPIAGVALASQPLHKILVGGAWGPSFSEVYLGALFVKQPIFPNSNSCSSIPNTSPGPPTGYHFCKQFSIGLNLQVSSIADKLKK